MNQQTAELNSANIGGAVTAWKQLAEWLEAAKAREIEMRKAIFHYFFPQPKEGANNFRADGIHVKATHKINRSLDVAALDSVMPQLPEAYRHVGVLIEYKPDFKLTVYREMPEEYRKVFEQALSIKEGSPQLEILLGAEIKPQSHEEIHGAGSNVAFTVAATAHNVETWTPQTTIPGGIQMGVDPAQPAAEAPKKRGRRSKAEIEAAKAAAASTPAPSGKRSRKK
jgi:hypothetical protein